MHRRCESLRFPGAFFFPPDFSFAFARTIDAGPRKKEESQGSVVISVQGNNRAGNGNLRMELSINNGNNNEQRNIAEEDERINGNETVHLANKHTLQELKTATTAAAAAAVFKIAADRGACL